MEWEENKRNCEEREREREEGMRKRYTEKNISKRKGMKEERAGMTELEVIWKI